MKRIQETTSSSRSVKNKHFSKLLVAKPIFGNLFEVFQEIYFFLSCFLLPRSNARHIAFDEQQRNAFRLRTRSSIVRNHTNLSKMSIKDIVLLLPFFFFFFDYGGGEVMRFATRRDKLLLTVNNVEVALGRSSTRRRRR